MPGVRDLDLPDLVAHTVDDARALVEAQVSSLKSDLGVRLGDLGTTIKSWLIAVCVAIVTTVLLGVAICGNADSGRGSAVVALAVDRHGGRGR